LQARSKSSTRAQLARDLHDSLAQDLVAIGYQLDLLISELPFRHRAGAREIRFLVSETTNKMRKELFALRQEDEGKFTQALEAVATPLELEIIGDAESLRPAEQKILSELVRNASQHSKGRAIQIEISPKLIIVKDDGQGLYGISERVNELGGTMDIKLESPGTTVEIRFP